MNAKTWIYKKPRFYDKTGFFIIKLVLFITLSFETSVEVNF